MSNALPNRSASSRLLYFSALAVRLVFGTLGLLGVALSSAHGFGRKLDGGYLIESIIQPIVRLLDYVDYRVVFLSSLVIVWLCLKKTRIGTLCW